MTGQEIYAIGTKFAAEEGCETPGEKIRSKGKGRGAAVGRGKGPIGVPIGDKLTSAQSEALEGGRRKLRDAYPGMPMGEALLAEKKQDKIKQAYEVGRNLALREVGLL